MSDNSNENKGKLNLSNEDTFKYELELWKVAIDTQMHFNELLIKMRTTVISIILATFGASAIALKDMNWFVNILGSEFRVSAVILAIGIVFLFVQFLIDATYYFRLLLGAVDYTEYIDKKYKNNDLFGLTSCISKKVPRWGAWLTLICYYWIPILLGGFVIWVIQCRIYQTLR
jgi:hypothetical protein